MSKDNKKNTSNQLATKLGLFGAVPLTILQDKRIKPNSLKVYIALSSFEGQKDHCYPSQQQIASRAGMSVRRVYDALLNLIETGWIHREKRPRGNDIYHCLNYPEPVPEFEKPDKRKDKSNLYQLKNSQSLKFSQCDQLKFSQCDQLKFSQSLKEQLKKQSKEKKEVFSDFVFNDENEKDSDKNNHSLNSKTINSNRLLAEVTEDELQSEQQPYLKAAKAIIDLIVKKYGELPSIKKATLGGWFKPLLGIDIDQLRAVHNYLRSPDNFWLQHISSGKYLKNNFEKIYKSAVEAQNRKKEAPYKGQPQPTPTRGSFVWPKPENKKAGERIDVKQWDDERNAERRKAEEEYREKLGIPSSIPLDVVLGKYDIDLFFDICELFGIRKDFSNKKYAKLLVCIETLKKSGQLQLFRTNYLAYRRYKQATGERIHGIDKFIGDIERKYQDGAWYTDDWKQKAESMPEDISEYQVIRSY